MPNCFRWVLLLAGVIFCGGNLSAQTVESWQLGETDCQISERNWSSAESLHEFHSPPSSQRIHFTASWGTKVLISSPVAHAAVITELKPSLWVKGTRPKVQLFARVVLPQTADPLESGPMTVLLPGPVYERAGIWQKLDFADSPKNLPELLEEAVWKLRAKYKQRVETTGAYLDKLVLNVFTGTGASTVWIDDVAVEGSIAASPQFVNSTINSGNRANGSFRSNAIRDSNVRPASFNQEFNDQAGKRPSLTKTNGTILEVRSKPFFVRSIQHMGESFEELKELGFNTIELPSTATIQQLRHAERLDMWVICPPPESAGFQPISAEFDRVLAWSLGNDLDPSDMQRIANRKKEVEQSDFRSGRPMVAFANSGLFELARASDILSVGFEPIGGSFILSQYSDWIEQRAKMAEKTMPIWATMQTEVISSVRLQTAALTSRTPPMPLEASQMKFMAYEAIAGGARGMRFLSRSRLDAGDPVTNLRSISLKWLNAQLAQLEPWVSGGAVIERTTSQDRSRQVTRLSTPRAKLVLIQRASQMEQLVAGASPVTRFQFADNSLTPSENAYHLSENGMIPLDQARAMAGNQITIDNCGALAAVMITQEPMAINRMSESYVLPNNQTLSQLHLSIAQQWMTIVQLINEQLARVGQTQPAVAGSISEATTALRQAQALVANGSAMTANRLLLIADQKLSVARRNILSTARQPFVSQTSSPLLTHVSLVPLHFDLVSRIDPQAWQPNGLAGGEFEKIEHMTKNGWENHRVSNDSIRTHVELATHSKVDGRSALMMKVEPTQPTLAVEAIDRTPLWIKSGPVPVQAGQLVRIHGWVKVDQPIRSSMDGLMIIDSIGGPQLAERINVTNDWQEFSIYRCPSQNGEVRLTFALTGYGEVLLDEVDVRVLDLRGQTASR